jgi:hypothetical protein
MSLSIVAIFFMSSAPTMFFAASAAVAFSTPFNVSNDSAKAVTPNVFNVGAHVYVVWSEGSGGIRFRASPDGGVTWVPPTTSRALKISTGLGTGPLISANGSNVYVVWSQKVGGVSQVFIVTSTNFGSSFNAPVQLTTGTSGADTAVVASWGNTVYVAYDNIALTTSYVLSSTSAGASGTWTAPFAFGDFHEPQLAAWQNNGYVSSNQGLATTHNNGVTWTNDSVPPFQGMNPPLPPTQSESWIAAYGSNVYQFYETKGTASQVNYTISHDSGNTWSREATLSKTLPDSWAPMVAAFGNSVWVADHTFPGGSKSQVYVYTSTNSGTTFSAPVSLSGSSADTSYPFTVATSDGTNVFVAWSQQSSSNTWIFRVAYSANGGSTWTAAPGINVSKNPSGTSAGTNSDLANGAIASFGTHCYAVYQLIKGTTNQIYFASS